MAPPVYSTSFFLGIAPVGLTLIGTVPSSEVWTLRSFTAAFSTNAADRCDLQAGSPSIYLIRLQPPTGVPWTEWEGRVVLPPGTPLYINRVQTQGGTSVSGYRLSLS